MERSFISKRHVCIRGGLATISKLKKLFETQEGSQGPQTYTFDSLNSVGNDFLVNLANHVLGLEIGSA